MQKIDKVVWQETAYISVWTLILSALMEAVFLIIGKWDTTVLFGNLYSGTAVVFNFFMIGLTVQKAVDKEEKDAKQLMKLSGTLRMLFLFVVTVVGVVLNCFNTWAVVLSLFFPRIGVLFRPYFKIGVDISAPSIAEVAPEGIVTEIAEGDSTVDLSPGEEDDADGK